VYCAFIFALSSVSDVPRFPAGVSDKSAHIVLYSGLGFLVARALSGGRRVITISLALGTLLFVALFGLSDETHQLFVPHRDFELADLGADLAGAACGTVAQWLWGIIGPGSERSRAS
jgi:VanZ family protein